MISSMNARVLEVNSNSLVVGVGDLGLQVFVPSPWREQLRSGEPVFLHTYLVVRENELSLYGFETREERYIFSLLLQVNGVGPRLALAVLSALTPDTIRRALINEQLEIFNRVPGVGKKTAQKIMLHLQDRIPVTPGFETAEKLSDIDSEVLAALTTLGYSVVEAQAALQSIPRDTSQDLEIRLRLALQYFS